MFLCFSAIAIASSTLLLSGTPWSPASPPQAQDARSPRPPQDTAMAPVQEARIALVIGNAAYKDAPLKNPVNDARAIAEAMKKSGFAVTELENATRNQMREAIRAFGSRIAEGGVGLFYFAGHGMQVKGRNFLIPVGADIASEDEVTGEAVEVDTILAKMDTAKNRLNILILDACRNNPFGRSFRSTQQGLAQMDAPTGTFVAFATAPGKTAADGSGANGLYTEALLHQFQTPGLKLEDVFKRTRAEVLKASSQQQTPWENSSIVGDFYFVSGAASVPAAALPIVPQDKGAAEFKRGMDFQLGRGVPSSYAQAMAHYLRAAEQGSINAQFSLGYLYQEGKGVAKDAVQAASWYRKAAEQGDCRAQLFLAKMYLGDEGVGRDLAQAFSWCCKAAEGGHSDAMLMLGQMYEHGIGVTKDEAQAAVWFRKVGDPSRANYADAQYLLGTLYEAGKGVPKDEAQAVEWYRRAAEQGAEDAKKALARLGR